MKIEQVTNTEEAHMGVNYYSNIKPSHVEWLWYPYIPCGKVTLLQGDPGEGKSTFIIHLVSVLTNAGTLPDGYKVKEAINVIYQCSEDGLADTVKPRLLEAGADCEKVAYITEDDTALTLDDERIESAIKQANAKLLVIDPLQAFIGQDSDMQSAVKMRKVLGRLADMASQNNCAVVLVGHMNKSNGGKNLYRGLGSIDIAAIARSILMISRDKDEPSKRYMFPVKSSLAPEGDTIGFAFDRKIGFQWLGKCNVDIDELMLDNSGTTAKKDSAMLQLRIILADTDVPSIQIFKMMNQIGISRRTVQEAKKELGIQAYKKGNAWYWHMNVMG